ncbi:hypothetical protein [Mucilaginibacter gotjawali]|uniref:Uncharacterized protein n=2 Tax=Mucilaginibacter gotjawali TaxID=1550579 RepID=A0A839S9Z5_9SPHI|nr:hypothetical protein [Mucilaginibacter gotjawali]MBB3054073.1 hypothetical protein [Mucilaginibacter gotjawali]BAU54342.1 hypothetical protein MgSA37_02517 [Mucilaginibacter gotjawali]
MEHNLKLFLKLTGTICLLVLALAFTQPASIKSSNGSGPGVTLIPSDKFFVNSFVDCNMAEAWIGDTLRIFPGKYGEDPLWGDSRNLKFADGRSPDEVFKTLPAGFKEPALPPNTKPGSTGLHGAVWFETVYQDSGDRSGKTLYAVYHNENYPATLPYDPASGNGYIDKDWPQGLTGAATPAAVCRIGIMKSTNGGRSWVDKGIFIEDKQPRMILRPNNTSVTFAGGVGDPSAVASKGYLYLFYGEYGYAGTYAASTYDNETERKGQCISVARIKLTDLDQPAGKAKRWGGKKFDIPYDGIGNPIAKLQISPAMGGGPASHPASKFYWGPSVSWNTYLRCWVMLMAKAEGPSWKGSSVYISFNKNQDPGQGNNSQQWSIPKLLLNKPGHIIWYPSLQPTQSAEDISNKNTCVKLGREARLFLKDQFKDSSYYFSEYKLRFAL